MTHYTRDRIQRTLHGWEAVNPSDAIAADIARRWTAEPWLLNESKAVGLAAGPVPEGRP